MANLKLLTIFVIVFFNNTYASDESQKDRSNSEIIPIVTIAPAYPDEAAIQKIEGEVTIEFTVNIKGTVDNPKVVTSTPENIFNNAAINAISKFKFLPRRVDGKPVEAIVTQTFYFKLDKDDLE